MLQKLGRKPALGRRLLLAPPSGRGKWASWTWAGPCYDDQILERKGTDMTLCPVALAVGCRKCAVVSMCPLKGVIGDYKETEPADKKQQAAEPKREEK